MTFQSSLLRLLEERGYIHQATDAAALDALASREIVTGYIGFDATAPSLHVGSLVQIMMLRRLQQAGHKPIVLMGGGTTKVGDPSGKDESRKLLTEADIQAALDVLRSGMPKPLHLALFVNRFRREVRAPFPPAWMVRALMSPLAAIARMRGHHARYAMA